MRWATSEQLGVKKAGSQAERVRKASALTQRELQHLASITDNLEVLTSDAMNGAQLSELLQRLKASPDIDYAVPDLRRRPHAVTSDPLLYEQWYLLSTQPAAIHMDTAWDLTQGSAATVVAVLDTGVRFDHPDIAGGQLLAGYDFVSNVAVANDSDGRDADASDPGDWVTQADLGQAVFKDCEAVDSSWHGTRVAGLIGALTNNAMGIAGAAWNTRVLPVRVLGKCGGYDSDIIAGMRWAAGLSVTGVPPNPTPATVINLSLGGEGACTAAYQAAVDEATARGVLVVASAGNDGGPVDTPANCAGVLGIAGLRHAGTKVGFSNLGPEVGISAPGGNCVDSTPGQPCMFSITVATNTGKTTPGAPSYSDRINYNIGTSFSAPMVAAGAALMQSVNSTLTPSQLTGLLKSSASPFPIGSGAVCHVPTGADDLQKAECTCTAQTCGAGMLNVRAGVTAALRPFAVIDVSGEVIAGSSLSASALGSFASNERTITGYAWSIVDLTGAAPVVMSPGQAQTTIQIIGASQFTLRLTVTDDVGEQSVKNIAFNVPAVVAALSTQTAVAEKHSGGGGRSGLELVIVAVALYMRRKSTPRILHQ